MLKGADVHQRIIIRNVLKGIGILGVLLFLLGSPGRPYLIAMSLLVLFLGFTDFGRQCPLMLSVRHHLNRMKLKRQSQAPQ
jgi:hypothetical protein